jgi:hypothetical protein
MSTRDTAGGSRLLKESGGWASVKRHFTALSIPVGVTGSGPGAQVCTQQNETFRNIPKHFFARNCIDLHWRF